MAKKVKIGNREYVIDRNVEIFALVPEGETEVHIFAGGAFIGTVSDLRKIMSTIEISGSWVIKNRRENPTVVYRPGSITFSDGSDETASPYVSHDDAKFDARVLSSIKRLIKRGQLRL